MSVNAHYIKIVYQTHVFARIATRFDCVEGNMMLQANSRMLSPDVDEASDERHNAFVEHR